MITNKQYFTNPTTGEGKAHTEEHEQAFEELERRCEALIQDAIAAGAFERKIDPDTGSEISGKKDGTGGGGFRLPHEAGATDSSHKKAKAEDRFDPGDRLDKWLNLFEYGDGKNTKLEQHGLHREHPDDTPGWCHLTTKPPGSGKRTFKP